MPNKSKVVEMVVATKNNSKAEEVAKSPSSGVITYS
jgi:hypothetical protein